ncbi:MAG: tetratricopeptide repeat protein [Treponema sp.]|nr:tetratricopeptide repeat protein [Treponema sp.]
MDNNFEVPAKEKIRETYEKYNDYFYEIMNNIVKILQEKIKLGAQPTYKSRVKSFKSYYKKVLRLKSDQAVQNDKLVCLTDMMGIRMICAFLEDINLAVEQLKTIFDIKEIEIKGADKKFSEFGYESIHVLIKLPESCVPERKYKYSNLEPLPDDIVCEIQIRTILQDAWAEVEHELIYKTEFSPFDAPLRRKLASINASLTLADITFQEIRDYQKKLQKEVDDRRQTFYLMADNLLDKKKEVKEEKINRVTPFVQGSIDELLLQAIHLHNEGNLEQAVEIYTKILNAVPPADKNVIAVISKHRGMAYFSMNNFDEAIKDFNTSLENDPKAYRPYYYLGIVYSIKKEYEKAIGYFDESLAINQFQAHTHFRRAMAYFEIKEYEKSMNDLNSALNLGMDKEECKVLQDKLSKKFGMSMK